MSELEPSVVAGQVRLGAESAVFEWEPPCVQRWVPGIGATWVHGYSGADMARWRTAAQHMAAGGQPTAEQLACAQVIWVCRTAPNGAERTFQVELATAAEACRQLRDQLPGRWVEEACSDSDLLTLSGYYPPPEVVAAEPLAMAIGKLGQALSEPEVWSALSVLSLRLYGVPLAENRRPVGEVLEHMVADQRWQHDLASGVRGALDVGSRLPSQ